MVSENQKSGIAEIRAGVFDADARRAYGKAFDAKRDTTGGLGSIDDCLNGAQCFDVVIEGEIQARYALKWCDRAKGAEVFIVAAAGNIPGVDLVASIAPAIERQCVKADRLTVNTTRRGLVKKLLHHGWTLDSYVLRKTLK